MALALHPVVVAKNIDPQLHAPGLGARLIALSERDYPSQEEVVAEFRRRTGRTTTKNTWARWEQTGSIKAAEVIDLAAFFSCDLLWLMTGGGEPPEGISGELTGRRASSRGGRRDPDVLPDVLEEASEATARPDDNPPRDRGPGRGPT